MSAEQTTSASAGAVLWLMNAAGERRQVTLPVGDPLNGLLAVLETVRHETEDSSWKPLAWHRQDAREQLQAARWRLLEAIDDPKLDDDRERRLENLRRAEAGLERTRAHLSEPTSA